MNKKNRIFILTVAMLVFIVAAFTIGFWLSGRPNKESCQHDYSDFTLTGTPDYNTSVQASRTCALCQKIENLNVYAATGLKYEIQDDGTNAIVNADGFSGKVLYLSSVTKDGTKVDAISASVFSEMNMEAVYIEEGISIIREYAFAHCESLKQISLPSSISEYGDYTFAGCDTLRTVTLAKDLTVLGANQFYECAGLVNITLPDGITEIPYGTFLGCKNLKEIKLPLNLTAIGSNAFSGCKALATLTLPEGVKELYSECFAGCTSLISIKLPSLNTLSYGTFLGCTGLKTIYMPSTIQKVEVKGADGPFYCCSESLVIYTDAPSKPDNWDKHFDSYNSSVTDEDGGELNDDAYFNLKVVYNCTPEDFPG